MPPALTAETTRDILAALNQANRRVAAAYPGEPANRQPVHTVYGGAHLFKADIARRLGAGAVRSLEEYAPDPESFARAIGLDAGTAPGAGRTVSGEARRVDHADLYRRVLEKLGREAVEDFRIDFEDGYGVRSDEEEDGHARQVVEELARGMRDGTLPPFVGIRIKTLTPELHPRAFRTLDLVVSGLLEKTGGTLPPNFVVTLPKLTSTEQVTALVDTFELIERSTGLAAGTLRLELMIELPQTLFGLDGRIAIPGMVAAARGRCRGAHFGTYDYTAACNITAAHQVPSHPACDFARHVLQISVAGTAVTLSDGATTVMPVGPQRAPEGGALTREQREENVRAVHRAWKIHYDDVRSSLRNAYYQGWDLNPAQLPTRYAAVFAFFLEARDEAAARLQSFVERAAQATLLGNIFDDAATGQGLLNFFLRGINCGALTEAEALATGLTLEELRGRSFVKILERRRGG